MIELPPGLAIMKLDQNRVTVIQNTNVKEGKRWADFMKFRANMFKEESFWT